MTFLTHAVSASILALMVSNVPSDQANIVVSTFFVAGFLDIDHIFYYIKDRHFFREQGFRGNLHKARSFLHEPFGMLILGVVALILMERFGIWAKVLYLAYLFHALEDFVFGISYPFSPFNKKEIALLDIGKRRKFWLEVFVFVSSVWLWVLYVSK